MRKKRKSKLRSFTKVEKLGDYYFKREDSFFPFSGSLVNGGKLRQGISLVQSNIDYIRNECNSTLITATSVHSPQGLIIAKIAEHYKLYCTICIGGLKNYNQVYNHSLMVQCLNIGADVRLVSGTGMHNVLSARCKDIKKKEGGFIVEFGINVQDNSKSVIDTIARQCINIPKQVKHIIVPSGSGLTLAGVLIGVRKNLSKYITIQGIGVGPDRSKVVNKILKMYFINLIDTCLKL